MIPKKIWFYWGAEKMTFLRYTTIRSFRKYNPDWEINLIYRDVGQPDRVWKNEPAGSDDYFNRLDAEEVVLHPLSTVDFGRMDGQDIDVSGFSDVHISDLLSWRILAGGFGVVADMDIIFVNSLDQLVDRLNAESVDVGLVCFRQPAENGETREGYYPVTFMMAGRRDALGNRFFADCYKRAVLCRRPDEYESCGTPVITKLFKSFEEIEATYPNLNFSRLPDQIVFPFVVSPKISWGQGLEILWTEDCNKLPTGCIGVHWYGGADISVVGNNMVNENNYRQLPTMMGRLLRYVYDQA